jgi:hypothetical protein
VKRKIGRNTQGGEGGAFVHKHIISTKLPVIDDSPAYSVEAGGRIIDHSSLVRLVCLISVAKKCETVMQVSCVMIMQGMDNQ